MGSLVKVDFYGDDIWAEEIEGSKDILVAVKPMVENIGVEWSGQLERIKRDEMLAEGIGLRQIPSPGGPQDTVCLPLSLIPGFLFGISSNRVPDPDVRKRLNVYKRECYAVLYDYFYGAADSVTADDLDWQLVGEKIKAIREARLAHGKKAAQALWADLGLPMPWLKQTAVTGRSSANGVHFVRQFLDECTEEQPGGRVQAMVLFEAFKEWAERTGSPSMTLTGFGLTLGALGLNKTDHEKRRYYLGIRIKHLSEITG